MTILTTNGELVRFESLANIKLTGVHVMGYFTENWMVELAYVGSSGIPVVEEIFKRATMGAATFDIADWMKEQGPRKP